MCLSLCPFETQLTLHALHLFVYLYLYCPATKNKITKSRKSFSKSFDFTFALCNSTPYMSSLLAWSKKLNSASAGNWPLKKITEKVLGKNNLQTFSKLKSLVKVIKISTYLCSLCSSDIFLSMSSFWPGINCKLLR